MFITLEGVDCSGKSTQGHLIKEYLESLGYEVVWTREPGGTKIAEEIRRILLYTEEDISDLTEVFLYLAARSEHVDKIILPALKEGKVVLSDRFYDSTIAYQGGGRGLGIEKMISLNKVFKESCPPDLTIFIDTPLTTIARRIEKKGADRIEKEGLCFMEKVRDAYLELVKREQERFLVVDGSQSISENEASIMDKIKELLGKNERTS